MRSSAPRVPWSACARTIALGGRVRQRRAGGELGGERARVVEQLVRRQHAVHHAPVVQRRARRRGSRSTRTRGRVRAGALGHPLRAAHQRGDPHHLLDQAEARALRRPQQVARERQLEAGRQAQPVHHGDRRERQVLDRVGELEQRAVSAGAGASSPSKTCTSTPAENTSPSARISSARGALGRGARDRRRAARDQLGSNRFSGGLERTISPTSPWVS